MVNPWYTTREVVKAATDVKNSARSDDQVDRCIESASRAVEGILHRKFYPWTGTRYFPWPNEQGAPSWELWLDEDEVIALTAVSSGGTTISSSDYFLEPVNAGPPYDRLELDLSSNAVFTTNGTRQRSIALTGRFGYWDNEDAAGALENAIASTSTTSIDVTNSALVGVGSILKCDDERMLVTGKSMLDSAQNISGNLTSAASDVLVGVSDGTKYFVGEVILVDAERMLIVDIAGNNLIVKRAWDGSVLAAHTLGADIFVPRTLTVTRGALGTTAATHGDATAITTHAIPGTVSELCVALALVNLGQRQAAYARVVGSGENEREASGRGLKQIRDDAIATYGRQLRHGAV